MNAPQPTPLSIAHRLGASVGTAPGPVLLAFCEAFEGYLRHFGEVGVQMPGRQLAALTLGCGKAFGRRVADFLVEAGFDASARDEVARLQQAVDDWMLVRLATDDDGHMDAGLYFRKALEVDVGLDLLGRLGVDGPEQEAVRELAALLGSHRIGLFGARVAPGERPLYSVYLHAYDEAPGDLHHRLVQAFERFGLRGPEWRPFVEAMHGVGSPNAPRLEPVRDAFVSLLVADGDPFDSVKLDYFHLPIAGLERTLRATGVLTDPDLSPSRIGAELEVGTVEHIGLRFGEGPVQWSFYVAPDLHSAASQPARTGTD